MPSLGAGVSIEALLAWLAGAAPSPAVSHLLAASLLLALRMLPMAWLAPWLALPGSALLPVALCGVLIAVFLPHALLLAPASLALDASLIVPAGVELVRGAVLAWALALPLHAFGWAGELSDRLRETQSAAAAHSPLGALYRSAALAVFFAAGGHELVLSELGASLREQPLGAVPAALGPALLASAQLVGRAFELAVVLCAPLLLCVLVAGLLLGLVSRLAAPATAQLAQGPLLPTLGLAIAMLGLSSILPQLPLALQVFVAQAQALMRALGS